MRNAIRGWTTLGVMVLAAGCGTEGDARAADSAPTAEAVSAAPAANVVTITAGDFFFKAPSTVPSGMTTIRLMNQGPDLHHVQLVRLAPGHTIQELLDQVSAGGAVPEWAHEVGGPNTPVPGKQSETTVDLDPGEYAIVCIIPAADGVLHLKKGMVVPLSVTAASSPGAPEPAADVRMTLYDYGFEFGEIRAGRRTIRVENRAEQAHEVALIQLAPGKTLQDMMGWFEGGMQGPPPGAPIGGTTGLDKGEVNFVTADLAPGEYALICFLPDAGDGKPHFMHGMMRQITVS